jgi:hypothetical protein
MKVVLAAFLGFCAIFVSIAAEMMFGAARGPKPLVAFIIMGAFLAICEFFVAQKGVEPGENWATMLGMATPPVLILVVIIPVIERHQNFANAGIPSLLAGSIGPLVGAVAAWAVPRNASLK